MKSRTKSTADAIGVAPLPSQPGTVENGPIGRRSALRTIGMAGIAVGTGLGAVSSALGQATTQRIKVTLQPVDPQTGQDARVADARRGPELAGPPP